MQKKGEADLRKTFIGNLLRKNTLQIPHILNNFHWLFNFTGYLLRIYIESEILRLPLEWLE